MHLRSITMKGFKSFPDRTRLEFGPGVAVIVGPNGSGKSNVTDAVLWALGEQSPLTVRGQTMQDVIFSGGAGLPSRGFAEVEIVIDNSEQGLQSEFSEIAIQRRLDRGGEGEYRLNGARCRLIDVAEVLSDSGLGKEMHSVVSQGRVEGIIHSKPADRRMLIEEAAGLGKHRKRRRRAELKLRRTEENLSRALDVEREARSRLRPLKRQAEAADLHARLERQSLEARFELAADLARDAGAARVKAENAARQARVGYARAEQGLAAVAVRRKAAEQAFAERSQARETLSRSLFAATTSIDRIDVRLERIHDAAATAARVEERCRTGVAAIEEAERAAGAVEPDAVGLAIDRLVEAEAAAADAVDAALVQLRSLAAHADADSALGGALGEVVRADGALDRSRAELKALQEALDAGAEDGGAARRAAGEAARRSELRVQQGEVFEALLTRARTLAVGVGAAERALAEALSAVSARREWLHGELGEREGGVEPGVELRQLANEEAELQSELKLAGEAVTQAEVLAQQARDGAGELEVELRRLAEKLGFEAEPAVEALDDEQREALRMRVERIARRREQLGPVNPLAREEYEREVARVEELAEQRSDLETALVELEQVIAEADRQIRRNFEETFAATARNFEEVIGELFPGGHGRLRLVKPDSPRAVIAGEEPETDEDDEHEAEPGVEVEVTPAGKSMRRLSLLSGGEKTLVALAFLFAVFLARPCPFYILDEVEAALDDRNIDRFLKLVRRCSERAQFIVVTHQKRTMDAADCLYGVSMGGDGVSKVVSRRLEG
ncbi:MAG: AAA family ATPase, partial [Thermoleophilaceae bacterium]|nr:AAA family ATPase [Thermoleophilaceae bacterium]